jgi:glycine/D-amino acid oxidase-like deaminating enzyme
MKPRVVIVGGGVIGSATAWFLARRGTHEVIVLERDPSYRLASSSLSASSIRQQFSQPVNIRLSQESLAFLRRVGDALRVDEERPDLGLVERGYLYLATAAGLEVLRENHLIQCAHDAAVALLGAQELRARFPWLSVDDLAGGSLGLAGEGWFDGPALLRAFRRAASAAGVRYGAADVRRVQTGRAPMVECADGRTIAADQVLLAAGAWTAPLAASLGVDLPVSARKRDVFVFTSPARLPGCPLVIDPSGLWFRPEGAGFICGAPPRGADEDDLALEPDLQLFDDVIWPALAARVPAFEAVRRTGAWSGYYEFNRFDHNGIVGRLPGQDKVFVGCGFSGHGMQQAPAVGRALAELIADGGYRTLDLTPLSPQRLIDGTPLLERNVI